MSLPKVILLLGKPGSGKSTQGKMIAQKYGYEFFSMGDEYRALAKEESEAGKKVADEMLKGNLLPLWLTIYIFQRKLLNTENNIVVDGVARRIEEAQLFDEMLTFFKWQSLVFNINVPDELSIDRIVGRSERPEDTQSIALKRIDKYHEVTDIAIQYFRSKKHLVDIEGDKSPEDVFEQISFHIDNAKDIII